MAFGQWLYYLRSMGSNRQGATGWVSGTVGTLFEVKQYRRLR